MAMIKKYWGLLILGKQADNICELSKKTYKIILILFLHIKMFFLVKMSVVE